MVQPKNFAKYNFNYLNKKLVTTWQMFVQSSEYDKRVANISLFIYIGCRDYIQIVATRPNLVSTRHVAYI